MGMENNSNNNDTAGDYNAIKKELDEEEREVEEAEKFQLRLEFSTNIIAAHRYSLRNVISAGEGGFDCEITYLPRHRRPEIDIHLIRRFEVRVTSKKAIIDCTEIRNGWGGVGELWLGEEFIERSRAQELIKQARSLALALTKVPENHKDQESYFADLVAATKDNNKEVVKQQEHDHKSDLAIAELCADVEVEFFEARMSW
jgi:hypothetical protein